jgi:hypothetical protein
MTPKIDLTKYPPGAGVLEVKAGLNGILLLKKQSLRQRFIPNGKLVVSGSTIIEKINEPALYLSEVKKFEAAYADQQQQKRKDARRWFELRHPSKKFKAAELAKVAYLIPFKKIPDQVPAAPGPEIEKKPALQVANTKKIRSLITSMAHALEYGHPNPWLSFVTITFEPAVNDEMSKKLLNTWLTRCKQLKYFELFLWRLEKQKNGTPHYHVVIVGRVDIQKVNRVMMVAICHQVRKKKLNIHLSKAKRYNGIDLAKDRRNPDPKKRKQVLNFADPKNAGKLSWYLSKYLTKADEPGEGRQWACSRQWSAFFTAISLSKNEAQILSRETAAIDIFPRFENDYCKFFRYRAGPPFALCRMLGRVNWKVLMMYFTLSGNKFIQRTKPLYKITI